MPKPPADTQWVDIIPPEAPAFAVDSIAFTLALVLILTSLALAGVWSRRPRTRARRSLRRLARELRAAGDTKAAVFAIRCALREGLGERRLHAVRFGPPHDAHWHEYLNRLTHACFAPASPGGDDIRQLIDEAVAWLKLRRARP